MQQTTIFSSFEPVRQFRQLSTTYGKFSPPEISIEPVDCFLTHQIIGFYPDPPQLIDLASDLTSGESTTLLLSHPGIRRLFTPDGDHQFMSGEIAEALRLDPCKITFVNSLPHLSSQLNPLLPKMFLLAVNQTTQDEFNLKTLFDLVPDPLVLLLPLGFTGSCPVIDSALDFCRTYSSYRFSALREVSPFWGASRLGMVYHKENKMVSVILNRIRQLFIGNFDYLNLLEASLSSQIQSHMKIQYEIERELQRNPASEYNNLYLAKTFVKLFPSPNLRKWYRQLIPQNARRRIRRWLRRGNSSGW